MSECTSKTITRILQSCPPTYAYDTKPRASLYEGCADSGRARCVNLPDDLPRRLFLDPTVFLDPALPLTVVAVIGRLRRPPPPLPLTVRRLLFPGSFSVFVFPRRLLFVVREGLSFSVLSFRALARLFISRIIFSSSLPTTTPPPPSPLPWPARPSPLPAPRLFPLPPKPPSLSPKSVGLKQDEEPSEPPPVAPPLCDRSKGEDSLREWL